MAGREPWERLPEETGNHYVAFEAYMSLGPSRTLSKAWDRYRKGMGAPGPIESDPSGPFRKWYSDHDWANRAEAWDEHCAEVRRKAQEQAIAKEARKAQVDVERTYREAAEWWDEKRGDLFRLFIDKLNEEGTTATQTNQGMRVWIDMGRLLSEMLKPEEDSGPADPFEDDDYVERAIAEHQGRLGAKEDTS